MPITTCVFDAYGTLFDVAAAARQAAKEPKFIDLKNSWPALAEYWRLKQLQYTWLRAITSSHTDFWQVTKESLDWALEKTGHAGKPEMRKRLLALYWELQPYPEVSDMLGRLKKAGLKTTILSNGSPKMLESAVKSAGIQDILDGCLSVESVKVFKPDPKVYKNPDGTPRDIPHIKVGKYTNDLRVGIYKLSVTSYDHKNYGEEEICHFVNYDGNVNPKWEPVAHEGTISEPRMFFLGINRLYQWCTKGMENDDSMMLHAKDGHGRMDTYDDAHISKHYKNRNQDRMIYEVYRVQTKSGVPHAIMNRGSKPYIGFNDWYEESSFTDANYVRHAWQTFHEDTRRCFVKNEDAAKHFCKKYKGENWVRKNTQTDPRDGHSMYQGECRLPRWSLLFSFILGENLIRMANRV